MSARSGDRVGGARQGVRERFAGPPHPARFASHPPPRGGRRITSPLHPRLGLPRRDLRLFPLMPPAARRPGPGRNRRLLQPQGLLDGGLVRIISLVAHAAQPSTPAEFFNSLACWAPKPLSRQAAVAPAHRVTTAPNSAYHPAAVSLCSVSRSCKAASRLFSIIW